MSLFFSLLLSFSSGFAQDFSSPPPPMINSGAEYLLLNTATTSDSSSRGPTEVECMLALAERNLSIGEVTAIRLSKMDFTDLRYVVLEAYLCEDRNNKACIKIRTSEEKEEAPISMGLLPKTLGCGIEIAESRGHKVKFLNVRITSYRFLAQDVLFTTYLNLSDLNKPVKIETSNDGVLEIFPTLPKY